MSIRVACGSFEGDVRGMNALSTECVARGMITYSGRGRSEEPVFSAGHGNRATTSRDIRIRKSDQSSRDKKKLYRDSHQIQFQFFGGIRKY